MDISKLHEPFAFQGVHWRIGKVSKRGDKAMALAYLDARDVMAKLDEVCGAHAWKDEYFETASGRMLCTISIKINDEWVGKCDGAGNTDIEGDKGGISDAFKRAAVKWGIGRYLYDVDSPWVEIDEWKKIKSTEQWRLDNALKKVIGGNLTPPPSAPSLSDMQETADRLKKQINVCNSMHELKVEGNAKGFIDDCNLLREFAPDLFKSVEAEGEKRASFLSQAPTSQQSGDTSPPLNS